MFTIREYKPEDERKWNECRVLSFLDSSYFDDIIDDVKKHKESYSHPVIDLVAECEGKIVGFIEVEYAIEGSSICYKDSYPAAMIWNIGVLPDYRRQDLATKLLNEAKIIASEKGVYRFEACTHDDQWVLAWYKKNGFELVYTYLHLYLNFDELADFKLKERLGMTPMHMMAHYTGDDMEAVKNKYERVHECNIFELNFKS